MDLILKPGTHGLAVQDLQRLLDGHGAHLSIDGWYGDATAAAVAEAQRHSGLVVDGIAGTKTLTALRRGRDARHLGESDLQAVADRLDLPLACIKAVNAVESRGCGFLPDGRPLILLERHVAYQRAQATGHDAAALAARYPALCNPARGGYAGGGAEWVRFEGLVSVVGANIAIESCSWGLFQIMGEHWPALGYADAPTFRQAMTDSEAGQLDAFARFLAHDPALLNALRAQKWADFARRYNGPAYKTNLYDAKLAAAFTRAEGNPA